MAGSAYNQYLACFIGVVSFSFAILIRSIYSYINLNRSKTTVNIASFTFGAIIGWASPSLLLLSSSDTHLDDPLSSDSVSWVGSCIALGALVGAPFFGYYTEIVGRKSSGYLMGSLFTVQCIIFIFAKVDWHFYIARLIGGVAVGGATVIIPLIFVEIAEVRIRGRIGSTFILMHTIGGLFALAIGAYVSYYVLCYVCLALPVIFMACFTFLPETPTYLMKNNKEMEAAESLRWYRGAHDVTNDKDYICELELLKVSVLKSSDHPDTQEDVKIKDLFHGVNARGLFIGIMLMTIMQFGGVGVILTYTGHIFSSTGGTFEPNQSAIIAGTTRVIGCFMAALLVERLGRKILMISSCAGISLSNLALGVFLYAKHVGVDVTSFEWIPVTAMSTFLFFMASGMGPIPYVVVSEVFSPKMRGISTSLCMSLQWALNFVVLKTFYSMESSMGLYGTLWFYSASAMFGMLFIVVFVPETKGRPINEILEQLKKKKCFLPK